MFFVILFLVLTLAGTHFFPEASWTVLLVTALAGVVVLRLMLHFSQPRQTPHQAQDQRET